MAPWRPDRFCQRQLGRGADRLPRGALPESFREALLTATLTATPSDDTGHAEGAAELAGRLAPRAREADASALPPTEGAVLAVGGTDDIAALRAAQMAGDAPPVALLGGSRAWVERDADDRLWMFVSADEAADFAGLHALRYYVGPSYAAFDGGRPTVTGTWPVVRNPLRVYLK